MDGVPPQEPRQGNGGRPASSDVSAPPSPKRQRLDQPVGCLMTHSTPSSTGASPSGRAASAPVPMEAPITSCVLRRDAEAFCNRVLATAASSSGQVEQAAARVDDACISAVQQTCDELCKWFVHAARRCLLAEPIAADRNRLTVKQLVGVVQELREHGALVDSAFPGAVELRSDFGDSRGCDPRVWHTSQTTSALARSGPARASLPALSGRLQPHPPQQQPPQPKQQELAGSQRSMPVSKYLLQAEPTSSTASAMQWLAQDADDHGTTENNPPALAASSDGVANSGGRVLLNEHLC